MSSLFFLFFEILDCVMSFGSVSKINIFFLFVGQINSIYLIFTGLIVNYFFSFINPFNITILDSIITLLVSSGLFGLLKYLYKKIKKIDGLGSGDIILIAGLTAWTGFKFFLYLLILSSVTGIVYYYLFNKERSENFEIPFGSSLGLSFIVLLYYSKIILN